MPQQRYILQSAGWNGHSAAFDIPTSLTLTFKLERGMKMKLFLAALLVFGTATEAHADMAKLAVLSIACEEDGVPKGKWFSITSGASGSEVVMKGQSYKDQQLVGGTEGADPYLQAVNNAGGYNITVSGGDFEKAFIGGPVKNGKAKASVNLFNEGVQFDATCVGSFEFTAMPSALPPVARPPVVATCQLTPEGTATALLHSATELAKIRKAHLVAASKVTCTAVSPGVTQYDFVFESCGMCPPGRANLTVTEDLTPTYRDGAAIYVKSLQIQK